MNPRFAILLLLLYTSAPVSTGSSGEWQTSGTQVAHKWHTSGTQVAHKWHTSGTQVAHKWHTSGTQVAHKITLLVWAV